MDYLLFDVPICSSQMRKAATICSADSGSSIGTLVISGSSSGRLNYLIVAWLSALAIAGVMSLADGPG